MFLDIVVFVLILLCSSCCVCVDIVVSIDLLPFSSVCTLYPILYIFCVDVSVLVSVLSYCCSDVCCAVRGSKGAAGGQEAEIGFRRSDGRGSSSP